MRSGIEWRHIDAALDEILLLPGDEWKAACDRITDGNSALRLELESLLAKVGGHDPVLDFPAASQANETETANYGLSAGTRVGAFRIIELLGRGGMGEVYRAERADGHFEQQVAIKLMRPGLRDRAKRFQAERQTLARLDHPNIAGLHDGGLAEDGRLFMVMDLVQGRPITAWCREQACSLTQRLQLFSAVCDAVAYAHRMLIVHRDLKPSNVFVTEEGEVKLLDFGVALLLGQSSGQDTREGAMSPSYAAPEQLTGQPITTATDVYALGVLLFELLTGVNPWGHDALPLAALVGRVLDEKVSLASRHAERQAKAPVPAKAIRGDLDAIIAKAMRTEPESRYESVAQMQLDVSRTLRSEPVSAREGARWYVAGRFLRRHRWELAAASVITSVVLGGAAAALWQARAARIEATRADQIKSFVLSILADGDVDFGATAATTALDLLRTARARLDTELAEQPAVRTELLNTIAYGLVGYGDMAAGAKTAREAVELGTQALGANDPRTLAAQVTYGEALIDLGRNAEAVVLLHATAAVAARTGHVETQVNALRWLSSAQINEGNLAASADASQDAIRIISSPGAKVSARAAMDTYTSYANMLIFTQRPGVVAAMTEAIRWSHLVYGNRVTADTLEAQMMLGRGLIHEGQPALGLSTLEQAGPAAVKLLGAQHPLIGTYGNWLGAMRLATGDLDGAILAYSEGIAVDDAQADQSSVFNRGLGRLGLGTCYLAARRPGDAIAALDEAIQLLTSGSEAQNPAVLRARSLRALALAQLGKRDAAEREFAAFDDSRWEPEERAAHRGRLAVLRTLQARHGEAVALARDSANGFAHNALAWVRADAHRGLGIALEAAGRPAEALPELIAARGDYRASQLHMTPDQADVIRALGRAQRIVDETAPKK